MKVCSKCKKELSLDNFTSTSSYCNPCKKEYNKEYMRRPEVRAKMKEYNKTSQAKECRKRYSEKPEVKLKKKEYYEKRRKDPEVRARRKAWLSTEEYKEKRSERLKKPKRRKVSSELTSRRRAIKLKTATGKVDYNKIWERDGGICHLCKEPVKPQDCHFDHIKPLSRGGSHTSNNIAVSHSSCNLSKGAKRIIVLDFKEEMTG